MADAVLKDVMQQLERPFYSLSKKPVTTVREYHHGDHWLRITPSVAGLATIYTRTVLQANRESVFAPSYRQFDRENANFATKSPIYAASPYELTKQVATVTDWTVVEITECQKALAPVAVKTWVI